MPELEETPVAPITGINQYWESFVSDLEDDLPRRFHNPEPFKPLTYTYYDFSQGSQNQWIANEISSGNTALIYESEQLEDKRVDADKLKSMETKMK